MSKISKKQGIIALCILLVLLVAVAGLVWWLLRRRNNGSEEGLDETEGEADSQEDVNTFQF